MAIPDVPLSCCCDWGTGIIGRSSILPDIIVVGHTLITTADGDTNLTALDFDGNVLWHFQLGQDSLSNYKKPVHVRFSADGFLYVVWSSYNLVGAISNSAKSNESGADFVGGVTKFDRNGNEIWDTELGAQTAGGAAFHSQAGNCIDIAPDGTVWVGTYNDSNNNTVHQLAAADGSIIQEFGKAEFDASVPWATTEFSQSDTGAEVCSWLRVTPDGNLWFIYGNGVNDLRGPYLCDSSGSISLGYRGNFALTTPRFDYCYSVLVLDDDDIVISGKPFTVSGIGAPPPGSTRPSIQRWTPSTDTLQWGVAAGNFTIEAGTWNNTVYNPFGYWVDGDANNIFYGDGFNTYQRSGGHRYQFFGVSGLGVQTIMSSIADASVPRTAPQDYVGALASVVYLPTGGHLFAGHTMVQEGTFSGGGEGNSMVSSINPGTGRSIWNSDLGFTSASTVPRCFCIAAFQD